MEILSLFPSVVNLAKNSYKKGKIPPYDITMRLPRSKDNITLKKLNLIIDSQVKIHIPLNHGEKIQIKSHKKFVYVNSTGQNVILESEFLETIY